MDFWFPFLFPFFFVGMWVFVGFKISRMGWNAFAVRYSAPTRPTGRAYSSPFTQFGSFLARYKNVVQIVFTDAGVYFYAVFLFRAFHPPFLVPWESVKRIEKKRWLFWHRYRLEIRDVAGEIHVSLPESIERELLQYRKII
ncbi:MAG TPA: hypothetical protein VGI88_00950 [Verrucomicrobiae bacterium]|jgi:hypothetical protein